jgi:Spy/CpxP family protein refolding chaperone
MKFVRTAGSALLATLITTLLAVGAGAQTSVSKQDSSNAPQDQHRRFEGRHHGYGGDAFSQLNLSDDQKTRLQALMQTAHQQSQAIRQDTTLTEEQKHEKMQQIHKDMQAQFDSVLTADQRQQLATSRQAGRVRGEGRGMGEGRAWGAGHGMGPLAGLNLTDAQKEQLKPIFESARQKMESLKNDTTLTADQRHEQMKQIHQQVHTQISAILTPEQQQQLQQHHRQGGHPGATKPQS